MKKFFVYFICSLLFWTLSAQSIIPVVQTGHAGRVTHITWDGSMRYLASVDEFNDLVINDVISAKQFYKTAIPDESKVRGIRFEGSNAIEISTESQNFRFDMQNLRFESSSQRVPDKQLSKDLKIRGNVIRKGGRSLFNKDAYTYFSYAAQCPKTGKIVAGDEKGFIYFCDNRLRVQNIEKLHLLGISDISFTVDGSFVAVASADRSISVWRLPEMSLERRLIPRSFNVTAIAAPDDQDFFVFGDELGLVYKLEFEEDKISVNSIDVHNARINDIDISPNPQVISTAGGDNRAAVVDLEKESVLQYFALQPNTNKARQFFSIENIQSRVTDKEEGQIWYDENVYSVAICPEAKHIAYSGGKWGLNNPMLKVSSVNRLNIMEEEENRRTRRPNSGLYNKNNTHIFHQIFFEAENKFYGMGETESEAVFYSTTLTGYKKEHTINPQNAFNSRKPNINFLATMYRGDKSLSEDYLIKYDPSTGDKFICNGFNIQRQTRSQTINYEGHVAYLNDIALIKEKNYLLSCADDASIRIWNYETGQEIMSIYVVDQGRLVYINPENYYMATGDAITGVGFNYNGRVFPPEQFDLKYNRPDIIMSELGIFEDDIVDLYYSAWLKRIQRLGFTEEMLEGKMNLPETQILNYRDISMRTRDTEVNLKVNAKDDMYNVDRINIYVNDVPLFGTRGFSLRDKDTNEITKDFSVPLSAGRNLIHISSLNSSGVESLKEELDLFCETGLDRKPDLYLISLAVNNYDQSQYNLQYTVNDGKSFIELFQRNRRNYNQIHVDTFFNYSCTRENVLAVKEKLMKSHVDDHVYIHIAGHGLLDENLDFYFATRDIDFFNPSTNGLRYDEIEDLLDGIPARNKLLLMDACHSGEVDRDDDFAYSGDIGDDQRGVVLFQSAPTETKPVTGLRNSFELMRLMFADLKKGTGTVTISAASGSGYALELDELQMGVFTYSLVEGLSKREADLNNNKEISVSELRTYVLQRVEELSNGRQQATSRSENLINDYRIW